MQMAAKVKPWTIEEMRRLPDDGNRYEVVRGELFVTPAPTQRHETILARLTRFLDPYAAAHHLGLVYRARAVMQFDGSEAEPDLMVCEPPAAKHAEWADAPTPILIVEVLSDSTRRPDRTEKRSLYMDAGVDEYWINIDPEIELDYVDSSRQKRPGRGGRSAEVAACRGGSTPGTNDREGLRNSALRAASVG